MIQRFNLIPYTKCYGKLYTFIYLSKPVAADAVQGWVRNLSNKAKILCAQNLNFIYSWPKQWVRKYVPSFAAQSLIFLKLKVQF